MEVDWTIIFRYKSVPVSTSFIVKGAWEDLNMAQNVNTSAFPRLHVPVHKALINIIKIF